MTDDIRDQAAARRWLADTLRWEARLDRYRRAAAGGRLLTLAPPRPDPAPARPADATHRVA